ncbi:MAG: hypothetical protein WC430_01170 [Patescibacteria group bacterium]
MEQKAWIVAVDMGYGHQRAAHPLRHLSPTGKVIAANNYQGIPANDKRIWKGSRRFYEFISRVSNWPLIGEKFFNLYDKLQAIPDFYPRRDLSAPTLQLKEMYNLIRGGWGKDLIDFLNKQDIPLITTFFTVAFFAEEHEFKNDIYIVICDADVSRTWVALNPQKSRIKYLASCRRVVDRLKLYGVKEENIFLTGFPLPEENAGGKNLEVLKADLAERIVSLDPEHRYRQKYAATVKQFLKNIKIEERHKHPLTLTFAVGGAGAQKGLARAILASLKKKLLNEEIILNLVAGARNDVFVYFRDHIKEIGLGKILDRNLRIIFAVEKEDYFKEFNDVLRSTDMLWTKPSELVFYSALGLPIIMAPSLGSQEVYNRVWLKTIGAGISQNDPRYTSEWIFDWVNSGWLAEAAMSGFLDGRQFGVQNIVDVVFHGVLEPAKNYQLL